MANANVNVSGGSDYDVIVLAGSDVVQPYYSEQLASVERPGIDGREYVKTGRKPMRFQWVTLRDATTVSECRQVVDRFARLSGSVVTIRDGFSKLVTTVLVMAVSSSYRYAPGTGFTQEPANCLYQVTTRWGFEVQAEPDSE